MRNRIASATLCVTMATCLLGCSTGPNYCWRTVDDWQNKAYAEKPFQTALVTDVLPLYPLLKYAAVIPDVLIFNPIQFWGFDVWRGHGAAFVHENPDSAKKPWFRPEPSIRLSAYP